jgi:pentatricopeptide repeat protein
LHAAEKLYSNSAKPRDTPIVAVLRDLSLRLPKHVVTAGREAAERASLLLSEDMPREAEAVCRDALINEGAGAGNLYLEIRRLLIEALAHQGRWSDARAVLDSLVERIGTSPLYSEAAAMTLHNLGLLAAGQLLEDRTGEAREFLIHLMETPQFGVAAARAVAEEAWRYRVLDLAYALARRDTPKARVIAQDLHRLLPSAAQTRQDLIWRVLSKTFCGITEGLTQAEAARRAWEEEAGQSSEFVTEILQTVMRNGEGGRLRRDQG